MKSVLFSAISVCVFATLAIAQDGSITPAQITSTPNAELPKEAAQSGLGGIVRVKVKIDASGTVTSAEDVTGPDSTCRQVTREDVVAMRDAAKTAALTARFNPATDKGRPVESSTWLTFTFPGEHALPEYKGPTPGAAPKEVEKFTVIGSADRDTALLRTKAGDGGESTMQTPPPVAYKEPATVDQSARPAIPKVIRGGIVNGKATSLPKPAYPAAAKAVRAEGMVHVSILIDHDGNVFAAEAVTGHPLLRAASAIAACDAKFSPTQLGGQPVNVLGLITYNFIP